jgi:hypothetical protein
MSGHKLGDNTPVSSSPQFRYTKRRLPHPGLVRELLKTDGWKPSEMMMELVCVVRAVRGLSLKI